MQKTLVVGLGGATSAGKSTLARLLVEHLRKCSSLVSRAEDNYSAELISLDDFFKPVDEITIICGETTGRIYKNFDSPQAIDWDIFINKIAEAKTNSNKRKGIVVVEGFLMYEKPEVVALLDVCLFLSVQRETCLRRRLIRKWDTPDEHPLDYFNEVVWPHYLEAHRHVLEGKHNDGLDVHILDGERPPEENLCDVLQYLSSFLPKPLGEFTLHQPLVQEDVSKTSLSVFLERDSQGIIDNTYPNAAIGTTET